jgi:hypothetical protein
MLIVSPAVGRAAFAVSVGVAWLDLTSFEPDVVGAPMLGVATTLSAGAGGRHSSVLK